MNRDPHFQIVHLLSWKLIDWPRYAWHGHLQFPVPTHHMLTDPRDADFLRGTRAAATAAPARTFTTRTRFPRSA